LAEYQSTYSTWEYLGESLPGTWSAWISLRSPRVRGVRRVRRVRRVRNPLITYDLQHYECLLIASSKYSYVPSRYSDVPSRYSNVLYVPHLLHKVLSTLYSPQVQEKQEAISALITDLGMHMSVDLHLHTKSF